MNPDIIGSGDLQRKSTGGRQELGLALALDLLGSSVARFSFRELCLSTNKIRLFRDAREGFFCLVPRGKRGSLIELLTAQCRISENGHQVRLDFKHAAGDVEEVLLAFCVLHANFAWLQHRQQW